MRLRRHRDARALVAVDTFLDNMRLDAAARRAPAPSPRLAATLDGRRPLRDATDAYPVPTAAPRRRLLDHRPARPVVVALASSAVLFGGLATAGALPNPIQHASAQLGSHVGVHLPGFTAPHPVRSGPVDAKPAPGGSNAPTTPSAEPKPTSAGTTTTRPARPTPTVTTTPVAPVLPTLPTLPTTPTLPDPGGVPVTLPQVRLPLPPLPPVSLPLPTGVIHR